MPQVPYQAYPDQNLQDVPQRTDTPAEAFGVGSARAIEGLGKNVSGVGDELWSRAVALKQLDNETEAKEADTQYMIEAGKLHADYSTKEGKERVDATPKYFNDLQETRKKIRAGLSNDMARRMYDSSSLSTMGRSIFNGAGMAASAHRQWVVGAATAQMSIDAKDGEDNPFDDAAFALKIKRTEDNAANIAAAKGFEASGPQAERLKQEAVSMLWKQRIQGMALRDSEKAGKILDANRTSITADDQIVLDKTVRAEARSSEASNVGNEVFNEGKGTPTKPQMPLDAMEEEARDRYLKTHPKDDLGAQHAVAALRGRWNQQHYAKTVEDRENWQTVVGGIVKGVKDEKELRSDPVVDKAINSLPPDKQKSVPSTINSYNAARDKASNEDNYRRLVGLSNNDVKSFLETNVMNEPLNQSQMDKLLSRQKQLLKNPTDDPRVTQSLTWLRGSMSAQLSALDVYNRTIKNKDEYDKFVGGLQAALTSWQEAKGKPPTYKEVTEEIGPQLVQQHTVPTWWGLSSKKVPTFAADVDEKWSRDLKARVIQEGGSEPTDEQIFKAWQRKTFNELYGKKDK